MRGFVAFWVAGTVAAILVTAGAFLLLASLSTASPERLEFPTRPSEPDQPLQLNIDEEQLSSLSGEPGQTISVEVSNEGEGILSEVNVTVEVLSEETSITAVRDYQTTVHRLGAGESATTELEVDLSPLASRGGEGQAPSGELDLPRKLVEVRAATPEGDPVVRTVVLPS